MYKMRGKNKWFIIIIIIILHTYFWMNHQIQTLHFCHQIIEQKAEFIIPDSSKLLKL